MENINRKLLKKLIFKPIKYDRVEKDWISPESDFFNILYPFLPMAYVQE